MPFGTLPIAKPLGKTLNQITENFIRLDFVLNCTTKYRIMNLKLRSRVACKLETVQARFDEDLFRYLLPPGAALIQYDGSKKGDIVHLKLPVAGDWVSEITEHGRTEQGSYFIDEGRQLPFPLKRWKHRHVLHRDGDHTIIEDDMHFSSGNRVLDLLLYPALFLAFLPRVWQYKAYFNNLSSAS